MTLAYYITKYSLNVLVPRYHPSTNRYQGLFLRRTSAIATHKAFMVPYSTKMEQSPRPFRV